MLTLLPLFLSIILPLSLPTYNHLKLPNSNLTYIPPPLYMYIYWGIQASHIRGQTFESNVPFLLRFMIDYNIQGTQNYDPYDILSLYFALVIFICILYYVT